MSVPQRMRFLNPALSLGVGLAFALVALSAIATPRSSVHAATVMLGLLALATVAFLVDRDLRIREAAANEVANQRETLRVTLSSIGDGVVTTDMTGRVTYLNGEAESLTRWTYEEAAGKPLDEIFRIVHEETRQPVANPALRALRDGVVVRLPDATVLIDKHGGERPIGDVAAPIRDRLGRVAGVVLVFRDVSEERAATDLLRKLAGELAEADRHKNEFLAMLAHELNNPLSAIRNSVAVLELAGDDPQSSAAAKGVIGRQSEHLTRLVEDLLDVSRISRGKLALKRSRIDLRQALEPAIEASRLTFEKKDQGLAVEIPSVPLFLDGDATRITQAVGNLLINASKFTPRGGKIQLSVGVENSQASVRVRDNGIGIATEHAHDLFDMFSQVDSSLEHTQGGLGIGLHVVKQLAELHGGSVEMRSDGIGKGSEFTIHLPILTAEDVPTSQNPAHRGALSKLDDPWRARDSVATAAAGLRGRQVLELDETWAPPTLSPYAIASQATNGGSQTSV